MFLRQLFEFLGHLKAFLCAILNLSSSVHTGNGVAFRCNGKWGFYAAVHMLFVRF